MPSIRWTHGHGIERRVPAGLLALIGIGFGVLTLEFLLTHPVSPLWWRFEFVTIASIAAAIAYCGYWLAQSSYESRDLWVILGWCVGGLEGGLVLAGGIYVHQSVEQVLIADLPVLFESLALIGAGVGVAFGITRQTGAARQVDAFLDTAGPTDMNPVWVLLSLLGGRRSRPPTALDGSRSPGRQ